MISILMRMYFHCVCMVSQCVWSYAVSYSYCVKIPGMFLVCFSTPVLGDMGWLVWSI